MPGLSPDVIKQAVLKRLQEQPMQSEQAATAQVPDKGIGIGPYAAMLGGQAADIGTTVSALTSGAGREGNPVLAKMGPAGIAGLKGGLALLTAMAMRKLDKSGHDKAAKILGYASGAATGAVAANNYRVTHK